MKDIRFGKCMSPLFIDERLALSIHPLVYCIHFAKVHESFVY
jgi:hypothetical protein